MKKQIKLSLLGFLILTSCSANSPSSGSSPTPGPAKTAEPVKQEAFTIKTEENIAYYAEKPNVKGFIAYPDKPGKYPALVLIHEFWGLNDNIKENARNFAKLGYIAMAADMYEGQATTDRTKASELATSVRGNTEEALKNLKNGVDFLKARSDVDPARLASVGWCFGGGWSYQMAKNDLGVKATVMYYGSFSPADDLKEMKAHIIGHFGEKDTGIRVDDVKQFQATLKTLSGDHEIFIYPNAGHGFANPDNPAYVKESAESAWQRTVDFLKKNL